MPNPEDETIRLHGAMPKKPEAVGEPCPVCKRPLPTIDEYQEVQQGHAVPDLEAKCWGSPECEDSLSQA